MPKRDNAGQADRRQKILQYIREHGPVRAAKVCEDLSMSRSSLFDDIRAINHQHPVLVSPKRGFYEYRPDSGDPSEVRQILDRTHIRRWYIVLLLSGQSMSCGQLQDELNRNGFPCSTDTLFRDLKALKALRVVEKIQTGKAQVYRSEAILAPDNDGIRRYLGMRRRRRTSGRVQISAFEEIDRKLHAAIPSSGKLIPKRPVVHRTGRQARVSPEQLALLQMFRGFPFADFVLKIPYRDEAGIPGECLFSVGMLVYSVEASRICLLGKDETGTDRIIGLDQIDMDAVDVVSEKRNACYQSAEFIRIFDEMFQLSADPPSEVRVRFRNLPYIAAKVRRLCENRKNAQIELVNGDREILYTDVIRGVPDFADYLRRFGRFAIAEAPAELAERLAETSRKVIGLYEE